MLSKFSPKSQAVLLMLGAIFFQSVMNISMRLMAGGLHSTQIVALRYAGSIFIVFAWAAFSARGFPNFFTNRLFGHLWRAVFGIIATELWCYALTIMNVNIVTALSFTSPIFATIFAIIFLGEKAGVRRWSAIFIGFLGMLIILRPDVSGISNSGWIVIAASAMMAGVGVMVKSLTRSESAETIVLYMTVFMFFASIPFAMPYWKPFTFMEFMGTFYIAIFSTIAQLLMAKALSRTDLVSLMPLDYTRLIFTAILAYIFLGDIMDVHTLLGAAVIFASTIYIAHREARKNKQLLIN